MVGTFNGLLQNMKLIFDTGGTNMRIAVSYDGKTIADSKIIPTPADNFEEGIQNLVQVANELSKGEKVDGIAGGIAVVFNQDKTMAISTSHLHGWVNKPIKEALESKFNAPVILENDTALVGLGEAVRGAGVGKNIVAYLTVSTGIGGVRIVDQKIDRKSLGFEPGHQIIEINGKPCHCGGKGHVEVYVGGYYLERDFHKKGEEIDDPEIWDQVTRYLAVGLNNTIVHWSPDALILGGMVMQRIDLEKLKTYLKQDLTIFPGIPEILPAKLGNEGGLYGALAILNTDPQ